MNDNEIILLCSSAVLLLISGGTSFFIKGERKKLKEMKEASQLGAKELKKKLKEDTFLLKPFHQISKNEVKGMIFLNGTVNSDSPIISTLDKRTHLITNFHVKFQSDKEDQQTLEKIREKKTKFTGKLTRKLNFFLKDDSSSCLVNIKNLDIINQEALVEINKTEIVSNPGIGKKIIKTILSEASLDVTEKEFGIKIGSFLTVVGEVIYDFEKDSFRIENPLGLIVSGKDNFINLFEKNLERLKIVKNLLLALGVGGFLSWGAYYLWKKKVASKNLNEKK